jgi:hypothetical protein
MSSTTSSRASNGLDGFGLKMSLICGPLEGDRLTDAQLRRAWRVYGQELLSRPGRPRPGSRPWAFWRCELGLEGEPENRAEACTLLHERGELTADERERITEEATEARSRRAAGYRYDETAIEVAGAVAAWAASSATAATGAGGGSSSHPPWVAGIARDVSPCTRRAPTPGAREGAASAKRFSSVGPLGRGRRGWWHEQAQHHQHAEPRHRPLDGPPQHRPGRNAGRDNLASAGIGCSFCQVPSAMR